MMVPSKTAVLNMMVPSNMVWGGHMMRYYYF